MGVSLVSCGIFTNNLKLKYVTHILHSSFFISQKPQAEVRNPHSSLFILHSSF